MPEFLYRIQPTRLTMHRRADPGGGRGHRRPSRAYLDRMAAGVVPLFGRT